MARTETRHASLENKGHTVCNYVGPTHYCSYNPRLRSRSSELEELRNLIFFLWHQEPSRWRTYHHNKRTLTISAKWIQTSLLIIFSINGILKEWIAVVTLILRSPLLMHAFFFNCHRGRYYFWIELYYIMRARHKICIKQLCFYFFYTNRITLPIFTRCNSYLFYLQCCIGKKMTILISS